MKKIKLGRKFFLAVCSVCVIVCFAAASVFVPFGTDGKSSESDICISAVSTPTPVFGSDIPEPPGVSAVAAVLIDAKSGAVLFEKDSARRLPMASTTKIMTAKIILEKMELGETVTVPKEATLVEGSSMYLRENEQITVETLLYGLLLESGNDAAHTLAVACSGSVEAFAELMNEEAEKMGLSSTSFANPHGLTAENHFTTAYELAYITSEAMKNEKFREIISTQKMTAPSLDGKVTRYFSNHNKLLRRYDGAFGVKTGYTKAAGRCLVSAAERDGETYIAVTLNDGNDWNDHTSLLDYAFKSFDTIEIAPKNGFSVYKNGVRLSNSDGVYLTVSSGTSPTLSYRAEVDENGGTVSCSADGKEIGKFGVFPVLSGK